MKYLYKFISSFFSLLFVPMVMLLNLAHKQKGDLKLIGLLIIMTPVIIVMALGRNLLPSIYIPGLLLFLYQVIGFFIWYEQ